MFKNIFLSNTSIIFRYIGSFIVTIVIARTYSKESFGVYQLALSTLAIMENIFFFSPQHLKLHLVKAPNDESRVYSAWTFQAIVLFLFNLIFALGGYLGSGEDLHLYWVTLLILVFRTAFRHMDYVQIIADSRLRNDIVQKEQLASISIFNLSRFLLTYFNYSIFALSSASIIQGLSSSAYQYSWKKYLQLNFQFKFEFPFFWSLMKSGGLLSFVALMNILQSRFLSFLVVERISFSEFSDLQLTLKLVEPISALGTVAMVSNFTLLSNSFLYREKGFRKGFLRTAVIAVGIATIVSVLVLLIPKDLILIVLGDGYRAVVDDLWIGCLVAIVTVIFSVATLNNQIQKKYLQMLLKSLLTGFLYVVGTQILMSEINTQKLLWLLVVVPLVSIIAVDAPFYIVNKRNKFLRR